MGFVVGDYVYVLNDEGIFVVEEIEKDFFLLISVRNPNKGMLFPTPGPNYLTKIDINTFTELEKLIYGIG